MSTDVSFSFFIHRFQKIKVSHVPDEGFNENDCHLHRLIDKQDKFLLLVVTNDQSLRNPKIVIFIGNGIPYIRQPYETRFV